MSERIAVKVSGSQHFFKPSDFRIIIASCRQKKIVSLGREHEGKEVHRPAIQRKEAERNVSQSGQEKKSNPAHC